jgi:WD40 repeat protein
MSSLSEKWVFHTAMITSISFSKDNNFVLSTSVDNKLIVWNTQTLEREIQQAGNLIRLPLDTHKSGTNSGAFNNQGQIITGGGDHLIKIWALNN